MKRTLDSTGDLVATRCSDTVLDPQPAIAAKKSKRGAKVLAEKNTKPENHVNNDLDPKNTNVRCSEKDESSCKVIARENVQAENLAVEDRNLLNMPQDLATHDIVRSNSPNIQVTDREHDLTNTESNENANSQGTLQLDLDCSQAGKPHAQNQEINNSSDWKANFETLKTKYEYLKQIGIVEAQKRVDILLEQTESRCATYDKVISLYEVKCKNMEADQRAADSVIGELKNKNTVLENQRESVERTKVELDNLVTENKMNQIVIEEENRIHIMELNECRLEKDVLKSEIQNLKVALERSDNNTADVRKRFEAQIDINSMIVEQLKQKSSKFQEEIKQIAELKIERNRTARKIKFFEKIVGMHANEIEENCWDCKHTGPKGGLFLHNLVFTYTLKKENGLYTYVPQSQEPKKDNYPIRVVSEVEFEEQQLSRWVTWFTDYLIKSE